MADPNVRRVLNELERFVERLVRKITLDITGNLIESTPVETGWARANWLPSLGEPETKPDGVREVGRVSTGKQAAGLAAAAAFRFSDGRVFIANNVPYILRLNEGSSNQAPAGFIQQAVAKALTQDILGLST